MTSHKDTMALPIRQRPNLPTKMLGYDRPLKLTQRDPKESPGLIGREVFNGNNKLHIIFKEEYGLWAFKMDHGVLPETLRQQFTSFIAAMKHAKTYFNAKNIDVVEE